jgi:hypothetical protein
MAQNNIKFIGVPPSPMDRHRRRWLIQWNGGQ